MAGVKISELTKWTADDIEETNVNDILIPVSIGNLTGALRASALVNVLTESALSNYISSMNERINSLQLSISSLQTTMSNMNTTMSNMNTKYDNIIEELNEVKTTQQEISSAQEAHKSLINELRALHDLEPWGEQTDEPTEEPNP